jgi:hypothetical protein
MKRISTLHDRRGNQGVLTVRWLLLALALTIGAAQSQESASERPKQKRAEPKNKAQAEQRGTEKLPFVATTPEKTEAKTKREEAERHDKAWNERWLTYSTMWLGGVTTALALFTYWLWGATRKLVVGSEQTAQKQLRAYISMVGGSITLQNNAMFIRIYIQVKNSGQTPAYKVSTWVTHQIRDLPQFDPSFTEAQPPEQRGGRSIVGPQMPIDLLIDHPITPEEREGINNGIKRIYVWGQIDYTDVFNEPRWTKFRCISGVINGQVGWTLVPDHDGADAT